MAATRNLALLLTFLGCILPSSSLHGQPSLTGFRALARRSPYVETDPYQVLLSTVYFGLERFSSLLTFKISFVADGGDGGDGSDGGDGGSGDGGSGEGSDGNAASNSGTGADDAASDDANATAPSADDAPSTNNDAVAPTTTDDAADTVNTAQTSQANVDNVSPLDAIQAEATTDPRGGFTSADVPDRGIPGTSSSGITAQVDVGINAVIITAAQSPWDAIRKAPGVRNVIVTGGIVALGKTPNEGEIPGGGPQPSWLRLVPDLRLLNGSVIPPVVPNVIDIRIMNCPLNIED